MILVERAEALQVLDREFRECAAGSGRLVIVGGGLAVGKSTLLQTFMESLTVRDTVLITAIGARTERSLRFGLLGQLIRDCPGAPSFADSLGRGLDLPGTASPLSQWESMALDEISGAVIALAKEKPVVIAVDDVQFGDEPSLQALLYLQRRLRFARTLFVLVEGTLPPSAYTAFRAEVTRRPNASRLRLGPLSPAGVAQLVEHRLGAAAAASLASAVHAVSGGNPLLAGALIDDQRGKGPLAVGPDYRRAVAACLHREEPVLLEVARGLGVLGEVATPQLLGELLDLSPALVQEVLDALEVAGLLDGGRLRHPAAGAAALDGLDAPERAARHLRAAELLYREAADASDVAGQLVAADYLSTAAADPVSPTEEKWRVEMLRHAAEEDLAAGRIDAAARRLDLAVRSSGDERQRAAVTSLLLRLEWLHRPSSAARHLAPLGEALDGGRLNREEVVHLAKFQLWYGQLDGLSESLSWYASSTSTGTGGGSASGSGMVGRLGLAVCWISFICPPAAGGIPGLDRLKPAVPGAGSQQEPETPWVDAVWLLDQVRSGGGREDTLRAAERLLKASRFGERTFDLTLAALVALLFVDAVDRVEHWCERLLAEPRVQNARTWEAMLAVVHAIALLRRGELARAATVARTVYKRFTPQGWGTAIALPLSVQVAVATTTGWHDEAAALLRRPVPEATFQTLPGLFYLYERGRHHLAVDHAPAALTDFLRCGELMREWGLDLAAVVPWRAGAAEAWSLLGDVRAAKAMASEQLRRTGPGTMRARALAQRVLAAVSDGADRAALLRESAQTLGGLGDRLESARSLLRLSRALQAQEEADGARSAARQAAALVPDHGPEVLGDELRLHQDPGAGGPDEDVTFPPLAWKARTLSEAERRVAALAALGHSNKEISEKLFITVSTVEQHLTRVYRKLNVSKRKDLPRDLAAGNHLNGDDGLGRRAAEPPPDPALCGRRPAR